MSNEDKITQDAKKLFKLFQKQNSIMSNNIQYNTSSIPLNNNFTTEGNNFSNHGDGNSIGLGFDNQGSNSNIEQNIQISKKINNINLQSPSNNLTKSTTLPTQNNKSIITNIPTGLQLCKECNTIHPPLPPNERCPNAGLPQKDQKRFNISDDNINRYITNLKNIIISNLSKKNIKDGSKFFQHIIINITKIIEDYNE
jgi:type VI protein secretion system component Hcp